MSDGPRPVMRGVTRLVDRSRGKVWSAPHSEEPRATLGTVAGGPSLDLGRSIRAVSTTCLHAIGDPRPLGDPLGGLLGGPYHPSSNVRAQRACSPYLRTAVIEPDTSNCRRPPSAGRNSGRRRAPSRLARSALARLLTRAQSARGQPTQPHARFRPLCPIAFLNATSCRIRYPRNPRGSDRAAAPVG